LTDEQNEGTFETMHTTNCIETRACGIDATSSRCSRGRCIFTTPSRQSSEM